MAVFGVSYAVASLGCELPIFLAAISGVFGRGLASGVAYFVAFALGFGVVLVSLTIALAMARQSMVHGLREVLPYVSRIAGALLVLTGAYVAWYGWIEIRGATDDATVGRVTDWSAWAGDLIFTNRVVLGVVLAAVVAGAVVYLRCSFAARPRTSTTPTRTLVEVRVRRSARSSRGARDLRVALDLRAHGIPRRQPREGDGHDRIACR